MKQSGGLLRRTLRFLLYSSLAFALFVGLILLYLEYHLPNIETLKNMQLQVPLRIYTAEGELLGEYGDKRRIPAHIKEIPELLIHALLATEDQRFYEHPGVDIMGLGRAVVKLIRTGTKAQGGSTITMQVARNFFLSRKKTYIRKLNEILLAIKIDHQLSKEKILELYLNKIYLGNRAYGVSAAAQAYYGKHLAQLNLPEMAMIAGLPKAPSRINPLANPKAALARRNHVLSRMFEEKFITEQQYLAAKNTPLTATYHERKIKLEAPYVSEMIRQAMLTHFGKDAYTNGYQVYTTISSRLQRAANKSLRDALIAYDERHGYATPSINFGTPNPVVLPDWTKQLDKLTTIEGLYAAAVLETNGKSLTALLGDGKTVTVSWVGLSWARPRLSDGLGPRPNEASDIVKVGDLIRLRKTANDEWRLTQIPEVEGALVALDPKQGAIRALVGGFNFEQSKFNRAIQATRQPGSSFKPFIYAAALEKGYTLASLVNDAPIVLDDPSQENVWRPQNDTHEFYGPTRLRVGLIHSRNLVSIRLLDAIGVDYARQYVQRFGFEKNKIPNSLSLALGSLDVTPLQLTSAYATFANGGFHIDTFLVDHITNSNGDIIMQAKPKIACPNCEEDPDNSDIPVEQQAPRVLKKQIAYLITSALQDVIRKGTGRGALVLKRHDLAGKTGTTNEQMDAWFAGFNRDIVTTAWVGYDAPKSLKEYAAKAALPLWVSFMRQALKGKAEHNMTEPAGIITVRIDPKTGQLTNSHQQNSLFEKFRKEYVPKQAAPKPSNSIQQNQDKDLTGDDVDRLF